MLSNSLIDIFQRDLSKLKSEIELFPSEKSLWLTPGDINNSPGNLCLHLCGNLKHFIGAVIGQTGYVRNRDLEFSSKDVPRKELLKNIDETISDVTTTLKNIDEKLFQSNYPINVFGEEMTVQFFLIHLTTHLSYHLGQINYLRRIITD